MTQTLSREQIAEWLEEFRADEHMNAEAFLELKTLCTMALSHVDAYERGQRDMAAAAVKAAIDALGLAFDPESGRIIQALRALSPGEWVAVPAEPTEKMIAAAKEAQWNTPNLAADKISPIYRALIAAAQE